MSVFRQAVSGLFLLVMLATGAAAQTEPTTTDQTPEVAIPATGSPSQTLEDILRRQNGEEVSNAQRKAAIGDPDSAAAIANQLGTLGGSSDPEVWRQIRFGEMPQVRSSAHGPANDILIQNSGMEWLAFRAGPLATYGGWLLLATLALLALFYLVKGRIRIKGGRTGRTITRFTAIERFAHWMTAGSFVLLALTGLIEIFGRRYLIPTFGHDAYSTLATASKWTHNNISWAFMLGVILIFVFWVLENIPNKHDLKWMAMGGGFFGGKKHPPAKKFNAGQKIVFWSVVILGLSISASGLALLFPFRLPLFGHTFELLNVTGLPDLLGYPPLPEQLTTYQEMQLSQLWHAIVGFLFMAVILGHIYIGTIGMEGAFDAMGSGEVDEEWAREHHNLWVEELERKGRVPGSGHGATPAE